MMIFPILLSGEQSRETYSSFRQKSLQENDVKTLTTKQTSQTPTIIYNHVKLLNLNLKKKPEVQQVYV